MQHQVTTIRNAAPPQDVIGELNAFIRNASSSDPAKYGRHEITKLALFLLKNLPATRDAVLNYFCTVFSYTTQNFVERVETELATGKLPPASDEDDAVISDVHAVLCSFVSSNPEAWAPIISAWSLELLGELSTKFAGRAHVSASVNESLQLWMSCRATRTLIDITTLCLSSLIHCDTETCISALLDTSVKHSPYFDWVVAHVGSCFPMTVITRVLSCGLKDFCQNKSYERACESAKLKSVVGILGHLAIGHCDDICTSLVDLFKWSLENALPSETDEVKQQKKKVVPFLLQLSDLSYALLLAVGKNIKSTLTTDVIVKLFSFIEDWFKYFGSSETLMNFIVHLILKVNTDGIQIMNVLLDCIFIKGKDVVKETIRTCAEEILERILQEIDMQIRNIQTQQAGYTIDLLESFARDVDAIGELLLSAETVRSRTAARLVVYLGRSNPTVLVWSCAHLLRNARSPSNLALIVNMLTDELLDRTREPFTSHGGHFRNVLACVLSMPAPTENDELFDRIFENLLTLLQWEKSDSLQLLKSKPISKAICGNLADVTKLFNDDSGVNYETQHIVVRLLDELGIPGPELTCSYMVSIEDILGVTSAVVNYFFVCCKENDSIKKLTGLNRTYKILKRLSLHSKIAKMLAFRELLERAIFNSDRVLFGAQTEKSKHVEKSENLLVDENRQKRKIIPLTKNSSTLNGGIIGNGRRNSVHSEFYSQDATVENTRYLIKALKACCSLQTEEAARINELSLESLTILSLLLVQFISPDVMYNGLPWPEEDFCKVTTERDFYIRRLFNTNPLLWDLVSFVAAHRPALCYCSVLLRAITATLIQQWNSVSDRSKSASSDSHKSIMETTVKILDVMSLGQLLLPPLSGIRDIIPFVTCGEVVQILRDSVWNYMRDHVPSPALFVCDSTGNYWRDSVSSRPHDVYTTTLRTVMQHNIKSVGRLYCHMFNHIPTTE